MLFLDKFFFIFFISKLVIVSILSYKRKSVSIIVFICSARIFSYLCTHFFFIKRKADQDFIFFLIDPNTRVYCYMFSFFLFRFAFFIIYFFIHIRTHWYSFFLFQEIIQISSRFVIFVYIFFWSYRFTDIDLKKTFFFEFPQRFGFLNIATVPSIIAPKSLNQWEFSVYFLNFFGLFIDRYMCFCSFFCLIYYFFIHSFEKTLENSFLGFFRTCLFWISMYCYSGESLSYDSLRYLCVCGFFELFIFYRFFVWTLFTYDVRK